MSTKLQKLLFPFWIQWVHIKNNKLYTKIYRKQTNRQSFLHINSEHPTSLKDRIPFSQAPQIKRICTTSKGFGHHFKELKQRFLELGYNSELLEKHIKTVEKLDRNEPIKGNKKDTPVTTLIPLAITIFTKH